MSNLLLFLSHSGLDTEAARRLKGRIEAAPAAIECGLKVWFDKDNLVAGRGWQEQLEEIMGKRATALAVYVGSGGVINWVEAEVRLGLSRALIAREDGGANFPFIPILAAGAESLEALPGFARQFYAVRDLEDCPVVRSSSPVNGMIAFFSINPPKQRVIHALGPCFLFVFDSALYFALIPN